MTPDSARLKTVRARLAAIDPGDWSQAADADGSFVEARGPMGELWPVARLHPGATPEEAAFIAHAPSDMRFLLRLVDRAVEKVRAAGMPPTPSGDAPPPPSPSATPPPRSGVADGRELKSAGRPSATPERGGGVEGAARDGGGVSSSGDAGADRETAPEPNFAAEAAMRCKTPAFKVFLAERHGLENPLTDERAAQKLRTLLGVTSRRDINHGGAPLARWKQLRADFREWRGR